MSAEDQNTTATSADAVMRPPSSSKDGIDITKALSILSDRSNPGESHSHDKEGGCCHGDSIPENAKAMGQTIDMMAQAPSDVVQVSEEERKQEEQRLKEQREKRQKEIREELGSMTVKELLKAVFNTQEGRVATYKEYER